jgi:predicted HicB family RNase H-like nuclease
MAGAEDPKVQSMVVRFPVAIHARLKERAAEEDLTMAQLIRKIVREYLEKAKS